MTVAENLDRLGVQLPAAPQPVGSYVPACLAGDLVFVSGVLPFQEGKILQDGKVGRELTVEQGAENSRIAIINVIAILKQELGDLSRIARIVRLTGHVASAEGFAEQPAVINGASDFLVEVFGEKGRHARLALGAFELPLHAPIELELIAQVSSV